MTEMTEGQYLAKWRSEGRSWEFTHYLAGQRLRILGAALTRPLVPFVEWLSERLDRLTTKG